MQPSRLVLATVLALGACRHDIADPLAPGAVGTVEIGSAVDPGAFQTLELRGFPTDASNWDGTIPGSQVFVSVESTSLDQVTFPSEFTIGAMDIGATSLSRYRVVAWLSNDTDPTAPAAGDPQGTATVTLSDCSVACESTCFCGISPDEAQITLR